MTARLKRHNDGMVTATRICRPYIIKATKSFNTELEARREELRLKKQKSRKYLEWLIVGIGRHVPINIGMTRNGRTPIHIGVRGTT